MRALLDLVLAKVETLDPGLSAVREWSLPGISLLETFRLVDLREVLGFSRFGVAAAAAAAAAAVVVVAQQAVIAAEDVLAALDRFDFVLTKYFDAQLAANSVFDELG